MKIKFLKKYQLGKSVFVKGQTVDIHRTKATELIINKFAVPVVQSLVDNKKIEENGTND